MDSEARHYLACAFVRGWLIRQNANPLAIALFTSTKARDRRLQHTAIAHLLEKLPSGSIELHT